MTSYYNLVVDVAGVRLDKFIGDSCPELSRTHAQKLIAAGLITVNGQPAKPSARLELEDKVAIIIPPAAPPPHPPEASPRKIGYEDEAHRGGDNPPGRPYVPASYTAWIKTPRG